MNTRIYSSISFFVLRPNAGHGLLILGVSRSTQRRTTAGRTALDERSARRRNLYLTTHNTHKRQTFLPRAGFEPTISAAERPQNNVLRLRGPWDRHSSISFVIQRIVHIAVKKFFEFRRNTRSDAVVKRLYKETKRCPDGNIGTQFKFKRVIENCSLLRD
jgi:hypothetical protein